MHDTDARTPRDGELRPRSKSKPDSLDDLLDLLSCEAADQIHQLAVSAKEPASDCSLRIGVSLTITE